MRSHYFLMQATRCCFVVLLSFVLGANGQTGSSSPIPSSSTNTLSPISSSTSSVSLSVTGTSTGTADFPTLSGYSDCVTNCFAVAVASVNCPSLTAHECYCNSTNVEGFKQSTISCLTSGCPQELLTGEQLAQRFCIVEPSATSISFPPPPSTLSSILSSLSLSSSPSPSSTLSSPTPTQTSGNTSGATSLRSTWGAGGSTVVFGILIGLASILVGTVSV